IDRQVRPPRGLPLARVPARDDLRGPRAARPAVDHGPAGVGGGGGGGGGDGLIAGLLMRRGCEVLVVDPDPVAIAHARRHGVPAEVGTAYRVSGRWDAIYCGDTLEHLRRPGRAVRRFRRVAPICYVAAPPRRPDRTLHDPFHHRGG